MGDCLISSYLVFCSLSRWPAAHHVKNCQFFSLNGVPVKTE